MDARELILEYCKPNYKCRLKMSMCNGFIIYRNDDDKFSYQINVYDDYKVRLYSHQSLRTLWTGDIRDTNFFEDLSVTLETYLD